MNMSDQLDAQELLDDICDIEEGTAGGLGKGYCRSVDSSGNLDRHQFVIYPYDTIGFNFISGFALFINIHDPDYVQLSTNKTHPHLIIGFDEENITNTPPELDSEFHNLKIDSEMGECNNCKKKAPNSVPALHIREKYEVEGVTKYQERSINLCVNCSPGRYDDVAREVMAFYVEGEEVIAVEYSEDKINSERFKEMDPNVRSVVNVLERDIL